MDISESYWFGDEAQWKKALIERKLAYLAYLRLEMCSIKVYTELNLKHCTSSNNPLIRDQNDMLQLCIFW